MCSEWGLVAHLSRIFFISSHSNSHDLGPKPTLADLLPTHGVSNIKMKGASRSTKIEKGDSDMAKKKVAEEKRNTRMTTQQLPKQSNSADAPHGMDLLNRQGFNKGTAFTEDERSELGLHGLLPPRVESVDEQVVRAYGAYKRKDGDLERHIYLRALQDNNEVLFYRLLLGHTPMVYTPMVRQPLLLDRVFPRQRDRTRPRLSRLRNGRPVVRGEFDVLMRVAAHRSHALTDAIESCHQASVVQNTKEHHDIL